jgi:hypothetical protein
VNNRDEDSPSAKVSVRYKSPSARRPSSLDQANAKLRIALAQDGKDFEEEP